MTQITGRKSVKFSNFLLLCDVTCKKKKYKSSDDQNKGHEFVNRKRWLSKKNHACQTET